MSRDPFAPTLFDDPDPVAAAGARAEGISQAERGVGRAWVAAARAAIRNRSVVMEDFTADDVLVAMEGAGVPLIGVNLAALGPVFLAAARAGEIRKTGLQRPSRFRRRHRDLTVWERATAGPAGPQPLTIALSEPSDREE
jgi:hypothetical protein